MEFDDIVRITGHICPFVLFTLTLTGICNLFSAVETILPNFLSPRLDHWCYTPSLQNISEEQQLIVSIPYDSSEGTYESCVAYDVNWDLYSESQLNSWNWTGIDTSTVPQTQCIYGWNYDDTLFTSTATSEWDLVCDRQWIYEVMSPFYLAGLFFGSVVSGPISDNFGRKRTLLMFLAVKVLSVFVTVFAVNEWMYMVGRFFLAVGSRVTAISGVVIGMEQVTPKYRASAVSYTRTLYSLGVLFATGLAYAIRDFRYLQLAAVLPVIVVFSVQCVLPESPRWLLSKGRTEEGREALLTLARRTNTTIPTELLEGYIQKATKNTNDGKPNSNKELFTHPLLLRWIMILGFLKLASQFVYFGVSLNLDSLFGNIFLNTMLASVTEIPAILIALYLQYRYGRKKIAMAMFTLAALGGVLSVMFLTVIDYPMGNTMTLIAVRCVASCAVAACTSLSGELFPSYMRQTAVSVTSAISSAFSIFSPLVGGPLQMVWTPLPSIVFGLLSLMAAALTIFLPETLGKAMPETVEDAVALTGKNPQSKPEAIGEVVLSPENKRKQALADEVSYPTKDDKFAAIHSPDAVGVYIGMNSNVPVAPPTSHGVDNWAFEDVFDIRL